MSEGRLEQTTTTKAIMTTGSSPPLFSPFATVSLATKIYSTRRFILLSNAHPIWPLARLQSANSAFR